MSDSGSSSCFEIADISNKGKGLRAKRTISPGELIHSEHPLLRLPLHNTRDPNILEKTIREQLDPLAMDTFMSLSDFKSAASDRRKTIPGIFYSNFFAMGNSDGDVGIPAVITRANHACVPNAETVWNGGNFELRAIVAIAEGEEITFCYLPQLKEGQTTREERMKYLLEAYGFSCDCFSCSKTGKELVEDDEMRLEVLQLRTVTDYTEEVMLSKAVRMLQLQELCRYKVTHRLDTCEVGFCLATCLGDNDSAKYFGETGLRLASILYGDNSAKVAGWKKKMENPAIYLLSL